MPELGKPPEDGKVQVTKAAMESHQRLMVKAYVRHISAIDGDFRVVPRLIRIRTTVFLSIDNTYG